MIVRISSFSTILFKSALATFNGLPFNLSTAWNSEKRPCPALPPAESPSTIKSSAREESPVLQRKNFLESVVSIVRHFSCCQHEPAPLPVAPRCGPFASARSSSATLCQEQHCCQTNLSDPHRQLSVQSLPQEHYSSDLLSAPGTGDWSA